jgi:uncharacterized protein (TIGR00255 family)
MPRWKGPGRPVTDTLMIGSMTGYSSVRAQEAGFALSASIRSTNHRNLDLQVRLPGGLESLEPGLRRLVKEHVARGHLELVLTLDRAGAAGLEINRPLLNAYLESLKELRREMGSGAAPDLVALLRVPGMIAAGNGELPPAEVETVRQILERVVTESLGRLNAMRAQEGKLLEEDLRARLNHLRELRAGIEKLAGGISGLYQQRLQNRLRELLEGAPGAPVLDPARLAQEVAYLASRSDITEELTRLGSHLEQAHRLLDGAAEVGKKLDFLLQEMNREANTLLSKTTDVPEAGAEIGRQAIEMKTEIEKLREQAQNIE